MNEQNKPSYPLSDELMIYDPVTHRYYLTVEDVRARLGEDLNEILNPMGDINPSTLAQRFLRRVSQTVYLYIYSDTMNRDYLEYILAIYPPLRERIQEMLEAQVTYVLTNGFIGDYSGVNIAKGQAMDLQALRGAVQVAPAVEQIANEFIPGLGHSLKYLGRLPCVPCELYHRGY